MSIERNLLMDFDDVTEQDNFLEYLFKLQEFESIFNQRKIVHLEKMIKRLERQLDTKYQARIKEFSANTLCA
jgi:hypothetical protein